MLSTSVLETIRKPPLAEGCPNCIRKTRKYHRWELLLKSVMFYILHYIYHTQPLPKFCEKLLQLPYTNFTEIAQSAAELWPKKTIFSMADVRHLEFKKKSYLFTWLSLSSKYAVMYQISSKSANCSSRNGDLMICNMAAICHVEFWNLEFVTWPLLPCYSASLCKISLKSYNRVLSYGKKRFLKWWKIF